MFIFFTAQTLVIFKPEKNETTLAYCRRSTVKCQHHVADMATSIVFDTDNNFFNSFSSERQNSVSPSL